MSRILVLPGTEWQLPLVSRIAEMGHEAVVVSPEEDSPCRNLADGYLKSNIFEISAIEKYCKKQHIEAVLSDECDIAVPIAAELGERLGLSGIGRKKAALYTDKFLMREFCRKHSFKYPEYRLCKTADDAAVFFRNIKKPIIIKPLDSNASHGVYTINTEEELRERFSETMSYSRKEKAVLAERLIDGTEFTIDGVKTPSAHYTLAISEKKHFKHNLNIANELYFTHSSSRFDYEKLKACNDEFVMKSGLAYGFTHAEYKYENGEFILIEIGARGGGNLISALITPYMSGYDLYQYFIMCALGNIQDMDFSIRPAYKRRAAVLKFFETPGRGGMVKSVHGLKYLNSEPDIKKFCLNFRAGDVIENAKNDSARIGYYIACSKSREKLDDVIHRVNQEFCISIE